MTPKWVLLHVQCKFVHMEWVLLQAYKQQINITSFLIGVSIDFTNWTIMLNKSFYICGEKKPKLSKQNIQVANEQHQHSNAVQIMTTSPRLQGTFT